MKECSRCGDTNFKLQEVSISVADNRFKSIHASPKIKRIKTSLMACGTCKNIDYNHEQTKKIIASQNRIYGQP